MRNIIVLLSIISALTACTNQNSTTSQESSNNSQITTALQTEISLNQLDLFDQSNVNDSKNYCSGEVSVYSQNGWVFSTSDDWEVVNRQVPHVDFALINRSSKLLFTTSTENISGTAEDYVKAKVEFLKSSGVAATQSEKTVINGVEYYQVSALKSNFGNWQWINVIGSAATTLSCGSPKETEPDYDSCLTVIESVQKL